MARRTLVVCPHAYGKGLSAVALRGESGSPRAKLTLTLFFDRQNSEADL